MVYLPRVVPLQKQDVEGRPARRVQLGQRVALYSQFASADHSWRLPGPGSDRLRRPMARARARHIDAVLVSDLPHGRPQPNLCDHRETYGILRRLFKLTQDAPQRSANRGEWRALDRGGTGVAAAGRHLSRI